MKAIILYPKVHGTPLCKMVTAAWYSDPQISYTYVIIGPMPPIANKTEILFAQELEQESGAMHQCLEMSLPCKSRIV